MHTNRVLGTVKCVLFIKVSAFQEDLIRGTTVLRLHNLYIHAE